MIMMDDCKLISKISIGATGKKESAKKAARPCTKSPVQKRSRGLALSEALNDGTSKRPRGLTSVLDYYHYYYYLDFGQPSLLVS